jgi:hypothetical protein
MRQMHARGGAVLLADRTRKAAGRHRQGVRFLEELVIYLGLHQPIVQSGEIAWKKRAPEGLTKAPPEWFAG